MPSAASGIEVEALRRSTDLEGSTGSNQTSTCSPGWVTGGVRRGDRAQAHPESKRGPKCGALPHLDLAPDLIAVGRKTGPADAGGCVTAPRLGGVAKATPGSCNIAPDTALPVA